MSCRAERIAIPFQRARQCPQGAHRNNGAKQEKTQAERAQNVIGKFNKFVYCSPRL